MAPVARVWKGKNLSDKVCHECAGATAREKFRPEPDEQREVDAWPDEKYPVRVKGDEQIVYPLFDARRAT